MSKRNYEYLGGRTVTVTYLGTMSNEEAIDFLAGEIARIYHEKYEKRIKGGKTNEKKTNKNR